ncbi:MAG: hypothetical protein AAFV19_20320 [Pseudomonadota bacterium]
MGLASVLGACGTVELFGRYDLQEAPGTAEAPYPRLIDTPDAPPVGTYTKAVPDPAEGDQILEDLTTEALVSEVRARDLARPVIAADELAEMLRNAENARDLVEQRRKAEEQAAAQSQ